MRFTRSKLAAMVLLSLMATAAACDSSRATEADAGVSADAVALCGELVPPAATADCTPAPADCVLPPNLAIEDGSRLRSQWYVGDAGDRVFAGIYDPVHDTQCSFVELAGTLHCAPPSRPFRYFSESSCSLPLSEDTAPRFLVGGGGVTKFQPTSLFTGTVFVSGFDQMTNTKFCFPDPGSLPPLYNVGPGSPVLLEEFEQGIQVPGPGSSRLRTMVVEGTDGSRAPTVEPTAMDLVLGEDCRRSNDRCLPPSVIPRGRAFPTCSDCDGQLHDGHFGSYWVADCGSPLDDENQSITSIAAYTSCSAAPETCGCGEGDQIVGYVPPSTFAKLWETLAVGARLRLPALTDGEGFCRALPLEPGLSGRHWGHPYDSMLGVHCEPRMTSAGLRCVPDRDVWASSISSNTFSDPACTQPMPTAYCYDDDCIVAYDMTDDAYYGLTEGTGTAYVQTGGSCQAVTSTWWAVNGRAETLFERLTFVTN